MWYKIYIYSYDNIIFVLLIFSDNLFNEICIVMVHISIKDPLWEVKIFTYAFWSSVIHKIIGKSYKEYNAERLNDNLVKLSATGCLHVSWYIKQFFFLIWY